MFQTVETDLGLEEELESMRTCFKEQFNLYVCAIFKIPDKNAHKALMKKIKGLIDQHGKKEELIIVGYAGHGVDPKDAQDERKRLGPSYWVPRANSNLKKEVDWSTIQPWLHHAPCDTLTVLNCCFAGNATLGNMKGTSEILAASDRESWAYASRRSFLEALIEVLTEFGTSDGQCGKDVQL
ncbi:hypothetical protein PV05_01034 [Exophiala xenobiotica]|uniref:CHAT domain-containing protein n=1 Tax=Exophiala xenobiotica TaxID=348802 RepID=A0A0D2F1N2_9EURO|nr:uncharacterized protein PV05_01034 [Exophiala xenobiotica]KIW60850.1 hypothetical protein PV05_01034 [Exophiala xenobiotica]